MSTVNSPYLRTSRDFPPDEQALRMELNKMYIDVANSVNARTVGLFPTNRPAVTGEEFFLTTQKQQTLRQVYQFTSTASINHGVMVTSPNQFTSCYGSYTDGMNSYGLIFGSPTSVPGQIFFYLTSTQIVFSVGVGSPSLSSGRIILQWLANP